MRRAATALVDAILGIAGAHAQEEDAAAPPSGGFLENHFRLVERAQASQPHWMSPPFTTTPRLNERNPLSPARGRGSG
jgi:hypothetical protein